MSIRHPTPPKMLGYSPSLSFRGCLVLLLSKTLPNLLPKSFFELIHYRIGYIEGVPELLAPRISPSMSLVFWASCTVFPATKSKLSSSLVFIKSTTSAVDTVSNFLLICLFNLLKAGGHRLSICLSSVFSCPKY